jgi:hypothetical protein
MPWSEDNIFIELDLKDSFGFAAKKTLVRYFYQGSVNNYFRQEI